MSFTETIQSFRSEVDEFLREAAITPTKFGVEAVGDPNFVFDLKAGREPRAGTIDKVREFIAARREPEQARASG